MAIEQPEVFWGLAGFGWSVVTGIGTVGIALATASVACVAWYQISAARGEERKGRTLEMVQKYDHDPILDRALRRLARARDGKLLSANPIVYRMDIFVVLNYLETMAIGIRQGLYIEPMVRDFMEPIVKDHIDEFVHGGLIKAIGVDQADFEHICDLAKKWAQKQTYYTGV